MVAHIRLRSGSKPCTSSGTFRERIAPSSDKPPKNSKLFCTHFAIRVRAGADQVSSEILRIARPVREDRAHRVRGRHTGPAPNRGWAAAYSQIAAIKPRLF